MADKQRDEDEEQRLKEVEEHKQYAETYYPENFATVYMLYINCKINDHDVAAFVDTGASKTVMSPACAERCGLMRLLDKKYEGVAVGVGTAKILGRVHMCQVQIQEDLFFWPVEITADIGIDIMLGLDFMKQHNCSLDLQKDALVIGTTGSVVPFLTEGELPRDARLHAEPEAVKTEQLSEALERVSHSSNSGVSDCSITSSVTFHETDVESFMKRGCSLEQAREELVKANGDVARALINFLAKQIQFE